ncbi:hypothetical protein UF66_1054 [Staphylococcus cohnii subsp. cohnii]|uniref:Uncharacterized protein n=1 Tax=Staphylococcus cohnii subsp. cohnii TaxID=74704 RepID=A0A0M2NZX9_STACC|nr:hypothetical protein UF66_1054 [Staphylococcus cohnii subsp. cohnii]
MVIFCNKVQNILQKGIDEINKQQQLIIEEQRKIIKDKSE